MQVPGLSHSPSPKPFCFPVKLLPLISSPNSANQWILWPFPSQYLLPWIQVHSSIPETPCLSHLNIPDTKHSVWILNQGVGWINKHNNPGVYHLGRRLHVSPPARKSLPTPCTELVVSSHRRNLGDFLVPIPPSAQISPDVPVMKQDTSRGWQGEEGRGFGAWYPGLKP